MLQLRSRVVLLIVFLFALLPCSANAQYIWQNAGSGLWSTSGNWSPAAIPPSTVVAEFDASPASGSSITLGGVTSIGAIYLSATRNAPLIITATAASTLTFTGATVNGTSNVVIANLASTPATSTLTIQPGTGSIPLAIPTGKFIMTGPSATTLTSGNTLNFLVPMSGVVNPSTFLGGGTWDGTSGMNGGVLRLGVANPNLSGNFVVGSPTSTYNSGVLQLDINTAIPAAAAVTINQYSQLFLNYATASGTYTGAQLTLNGIGNRSSGYGRGALRNSATICTWSSPIVLASNSVIYTGGALTLSGNISGSGQLIKEGAAVLTIKGASNTFTGGVKISEGSISVGSNLGTGNAITFAQNSSFSPTITLSAAVSHTITGLSSSFTDATGTYTNTLAMGATCTLTINQSTNSTFGAGAVSTLNSIITGTATSYVVKTGTGVLTLTNGGHTFYGGLTITAGELRLAPASTITLASGANYCPINMNGGILGTTGIGSGVICSLGVLNNVVSSTISLDAATAHTIRFNGLGTNTGTLNITGWQGAFDGTSGTKGKIFIGSTASLSTAQLAQIQFTDAGNVLSAVQLSTGEIVPKVTINITAAGYGPFINGTTNVISVSYNTPASFFTGNFKVQLSDTSGAFANYTSNIIGTGTSATSGSISATIPSTTALGYYRVRVLNTTPYTVASPDNGSSIALINANAPYISTLSAYKNVNPGSSITISGLNFNATAANNLVYFGAVKGHVNSGSTTALNVTVPYGATIGPVTVYDTIVKTAGNSAYPYLPAYNNSYFETGSIRFQPKTDYTTGTCPNIAAIGDLDGDGLPDLVSVNKISASLTIMQNQGTGVAGFNIPSLSLPLQGQPSNVKIADIDGDGRPDIIIATGSGGPSIGIYRNITNFASSTTPRTLAFSTRVDLVISSVTNSPGVLAIADFDGDGKLDIAASCYYTNPGKLIILKNNNSVGSVNSFTLNSYNTGVNTNALTSSLTVGDFNNDHLPDICVLNEDTYNAGTMSVFRNTSTSGILSFAAPSAVAVGIYPVDIQSADMDGDGNTDVVVTSSIDSSVSLYRNTSSSTSAITFGSRVIIGSSIGNPSGIALGDLDADGKPDVVVASWIYSGFVKVWKNNSTSGSPSFTGATTLATNRFPAGINIGDLDGDGYPEIVAGNTGQDTGNTVSIFRNTPLPIIGSISPLTDSVCVGASSTLTYSLSLPAGETGSWSSSDITIATVSNTGVVYGVSAGNADISYNVNVTAGNIGRSVIRTVTVKPLPIVNITGFRGVCQGATTTLSGTPSGGSWTHANAVTTVSAVGAVTGVAASGTDIITYTYAGTNGCTNTDTQAMPIISLPVTGTINGLDSVCPGGQITLTNTGDLGGIWVSNDTLLAIVGLSTGIVTGVNSGAPIINYKIINGCGTFTTSKVVNVKSLPDPGVITGSSTVCAGATTTLTDAVAAGVWSSSNGTVATISASGIVTGVTTGNASISYVVTGSCGSSATTLPISVTTVPFAPGAISGSSVVCAGNSITLTNASSGGTWSINDVSLASINSSTGVLSGVAAGNPTVSYSLSNSCGYSAPTTVIINVLSYPTANITSAFPPCTGYSTNIVFTGTSGAIAGYKVDGGSLIETTLTGGTATISTGVLAATHTYQLYSVRNAACTFIRDTSISLSPQVMTWVGGTTGAESNWGTATNWSCGVVPAVTDNIIVPVATFIPQIPVSGSGNVKDITITSLASVAINSGASLNIKGNLINNGSITGRGKVVLNNASLQIIGGKGSIANIELNNAAGARIDTASKLVITNTLYVTSGVLHTNDSLELSATYDTSVPARIAALPSSGASISGKVTADLGIIGGYRRYRFVSHPFSSSISLGQLENFIDITGVGGSGNGFTPTITNAPSAFRFDPYTSNDTMSYDPGWKAFTQINASATGNNLFKQYQGIRLFVRGAKGEGIVPNWFTYTPSSVMVKMMGLVNQGPQVVTLSQGATNPAHQSFNMVGNPYPSPVDIGTILYNAKQAHQVTGSSFYVWDPRLPAGGGYVVVLIDGSPFYIPAYSSFQVQADHDGAVINFAESNKGTTANNYLFKSAAQYTTLNIYDTDYNLWDNLRIRFSDSATYNDDKELDAVKIISTDFKFYSLGEDGRKLAIDNRPYSVDKIIPLGIGSTYKQDFIIKAENITVPIGGSLYLHDRLLNKTIELSLGSEYRFTVNDDKETQGDSRFELAFKPITTASNDLKVTLSPNPATDDVKISFASGSKEDLALNVFDINGVSVYTRKVSGVQSGVVSLPLSEFASGIYMVELTQGNQTVIQRLVKE